MGWRNLSETAEKKFVEPTRSECLTAPYLNSIISLREGKMTSDAYTAKLLIAPTVSAIGGVLSELIIESCCKPALQSRSAFTIALSGGSLPSFLQELPRYCRRAGVDPQWEKWHVLLADERCVLSTDAESNLGSIQSNFTNSVCSMRLHLPVQY
jgi:hypothetical protein